MIDEIDNWMHTELIHHPERYERLDADGNTN